MVTLLVTVVPSDFVVVAVTVCDFPYSSVLSLDGLIVNVFAPSSLPEL